MLAGGSAVAAPAPGAQTCFDAHEVNNVGGRDGAAFHVRVNGAELYRIELEGPCLALGWERSVTSTLQPRDGGDGVCPGTSVIVRPNWGSGPRECRVTAVRRLTAAEAAALPERLRP
jgi:hypothetical protein